MAATSTNQRAAPWAAALLVALAALFLVSAWPRITAPFADSDDGINGAVWGYDSRALRELGPLESRLGGVRLDGTKYATHPPLLVIETAIVERVVGEHPWSTRAAAWLGSLAVIGLLFLLLRAIGLSPVTAAAATAAAGASHMLLVYGPMLDTMVIALPFALATALVWYREWTDQARWSPWATLALATVTCLSGWQATFMVGLCGVALASRRRIRLGPALREALPYLAAVAIGVVLTLAWARWVYGSFTVLNDKLVRRTGGEDVSLADMVSFQLPWLSQLLGLGFLAWIACAVSLRDRRFRPVAALALGSVIPYAIIFKEGSGGHQYWNYWGLFPAAVGIAYVFDLIATALARRFPTRLGIQRGVLVGIVALVAVVNLSQPDQAGALIEQGQKALAVVEATDWSTTGTVPYVAEPNRIDDWLRYRGGPPGQPLTSAESLRALAASHPDAPVLVLGSCASPDPTGICEQLTFSGGRDADVVDPTVVRADVLAARLDQPAR